MRREKWLFLPFVGFFLEWLSLRWPHGTASSPPPHLSALIVMGAARVPEEAKLALRETTSERWPHCGLILTDRKCVVFF